MIGKQSFSERIGRGYRRDPFFYTPVWLALPTLALGLCLLVWANLGEALTLTLAALLLIAFFAWISLAVRWGQRKYLNRKGEQRRRATSRDAH